MHLHADRSGSGERVVLVHGFTQTSRCWGPAAADLERDHEVIRVDAPGHGRSSEVRADLQVGGRLIAECGGRATYVGYSMGARFCLHAALSNPDLVRGLVLLGGTPGIEDEGERAARHQQDLRTAAQIESQGLAGFVDSWMSQPLFAGLTADQGFREERLMNTVEGLQSSLTQAGTGSQEPSWHLLRTLDMPVLVMAGELDVKFSEIGRRMSSAIGTNATVALIPGAGHSAHLEQPAAFIAALRPWLAAHSL